MNRVATTKFELAYRYFMDCGYPDAYLFWLALHFAERGDYEAAIEALTAFQAGREFYDVEVDLLNDLMSELIQPPQLPEPEPVEDLVEEEEVTA